MDAYAHADKAVKDAEAAYGAALAAGDAAAAREADVTLAQAIRSRIECARARTHGPTPEQTREIWNRFYPEHAV